MTLATERRGRIRVVADSINTAGARLTTVLTVVGAGQARELHTLTHTVCTGPADDSLNPHWPQPALITGTDFRDLFAHPRLTALADAVADAVLARPAHPVGDDDMHAPFVTATERQRLDTPMTGAVSAARCHHLQAPRDLLADVARYQHLLLSPGHRGGLWHPALPDTHVALAGKTLRGGVFPGWIAWRELLTPRGDPL